MNIQDFRARFEPLIRRLFHFYWRFARGMTLGVRAVVLDGENRVFLVRHSYVSGWHLPGGGVETGETFLSSLRRELIEEGRIEMTGQPLLHGLFFNRRDLYQLQGRFRTLRIRRRSSYASHRCRLRCRRSSRNRRI